MDIWIVIHLDRHTDADILVFRNKDDAIKLAQSRADEYKIDPDDPELGVQKISVWEYYCSLNHEGDCIYVESGILY